MRQLKGTILLPPRTQLFTVQQAIDIALQSFQASRLDEAQGILRRALNEEPEHSFAHNLLGIIAYQMGEWKNAADSYQLALKHNPDYAEAYGNLALALIPLNRLAEAEQSCQMALKLNPNFFGVHNTLGIVLDGLGRTEEAEQSYANAIRINGDDPDAYSNMANLLVENGRKADAERYLRQFTKLVPSDTLALNNLATILIQMDRGNEAISILEELCRLDPEDIHGQSLRLAYLGAAPPPKSQSSQYLNNLYKERAANWDKKDDEKPYHAPDLVIDMAVRVSGGLAGLDVLDAGCGTGFIGDFLNNKCRSLIGVDMSPEMLVFAEGNDVYDRLECADLIDYMRDHTHSFNAILSAATFIHFGDLQPVFSAASAALKENGVFAFTVFPFDGEKFGVNAMAFYAHSEDYVTSTAIDAGFEVIAIDRKVQEYNESDGKPVDCLVIGLRLC
jgi:predicted TPR repeat methyltransferase